MTDASNHNPHNAINEIQQDQLGRNPMAERLAKIILTNYRRQNGYTVAIYGDWGTGKTSVMNLVKEYLKKPELRAEFKTEEPIIIDFNPWFYGHTQRLDELFLETLFNAIETHLLANPISKPRLYARWNEYGGTLCRWCFRLFFLVPFYFVFYPKASLATTQTFLTFCYHYYGHVTLLLLLLSNFSGVQKAWFRFWKIGGSLSNDFKQFEALLKPIAEKVSLASIFDFWVANQPPAETLKSQISNHLASFESPIVVFLDDLDRLTNEEVLNVFRLVREVANFPNVVYVLGMDKDQVANAISSQLAYKDTDLGMAYMEKIVHHSIELLQFPFLPRILNQLLNEKIPEELDSFKYEDNYHYKEHAEKLFEGIACYLKTPRQIIQLVECFNSEFSSLKKDVDFFEYLLLVFLRLHFTNVYHWFYENSLSLINDEDEKSSNNVSPRYKFTTVKEEENRPLLEEIADYLLRPLEQVAGLRWGDKELFHTGGSKVEYKRFRQKPYSYYFFYTSYEKARATEFLNEATRISECTSLNPLVFCHIIEEVEEKNSYDYALKVIEKCRTHLYTENFKKQKDEWLWVFTKFAKLTLKLVKSDTESKTIEEVFNILSKNDNLAPLSQFNFLRFGILIGFKQQEEIYEQVKEVGNKLLSAKNSPEVTWKEREVEHLRNVLPFYLEELKVEEEQKLEWKRRFTENVLIPLHIRGFESQIEISKSWGLLDYILERYHKQYKNDLLYYWEINILLDLQNPEIISMLKDIQAFESKQMKNQIGNTKPDYVQNGQLQKLLDDIERHKNLPNPTLT
ncbi:MAG: hypothetical protein H2174_09635 [Vampirovibrio sp.]|nr:hypothetical protein [Vampirovibrio sp.]